MKKLLIIGLVLLSVALLSAFLIVPIFAQGGQPSDQDWQQMYQACQNGDWQGMRDAMQNIWGDSTADGTGACGAHGYPAPGNTPAKPGGTTNPAPRTSAWGGSGMMGWY